MWYQVMIPIKVLSQINYHVFTFLTFRYANMGQYGREHLGNYPTVLVCF